MTQPHLNLFLICICYSHKNYPKKVVSQLMVYYLPISPGLDSDYCISILIPDGRLLSVLLYSIIL